MITKWVLKQKITTAKSKTKTKVTLPVKSLYEELIEDLQQKELLEKEYKELLISELIIAVIKRDELSVRRLAKDAGVSPTIIQELKSGKRTNITLNNFNKVLNALGYQLAFEPLRK